ncbi:MAG TPA: geranylgeranylglycerol-phosphate geranylgeranyltransferase [Chitinophagaceae bacterium]
MRLTAAFLKMIRLPNLFFIALTQLLFHCCILRPVLTQVGRPPLINGMLFIFLAIASVLIAAAGYIINDYFDINIDEINKPKKNVVDHIVSRRWAMLWHFIMSGLGLLLSFYVSWKTGLWYIVIANFFCIALLFGYSVSLKRKLLSGNILISLLTAWVILVLCLSESVPFFTRNESWSVAANTKILRLGFLYAGFAFISSLIREAIKDIEDMEGDAKYGCRTMPIVWGVHATKVYVAVWLIVLLALLLGVQVYVLQFKWWPAIVYSIVLIILPLLYVFYKLFRARSSKDFHALSSWTKLVMFTGILSMIFFYFYL